MFKTSMNSNARSKTPNNDSRTTTGSSKKLNIRDLELAPPDTTSMRSVWYLLSFVILVPVTALILTALFTHNWQRTVAAVQPSYQFFTSGLWFQCRHVKVYWLNNLEDVFCTSLDFSTTPWIFAVQVFYTFGAFLNSVSLIVATIGLCFDLAENKLVLPSFLMWALISSCVSQLIAICIYGGKSIADYSQFQPDYSLIIASVCLGCNFICVFMYLAEIITKQIQARGRTQAT